MTALIDRYLVGTISRQVTDVVVAYLVVLIAYGGQISGPTDVVALAQVILAVKLHVFALPLAWTDVFGTVPLWAWYVILVLWIVRFLARAGYSTEAIVAQLELAYNERSETPDRDQATTVTDGGCEGTENNQPDREDDGLTRNTRWDGTTEVTNDSPKTTDSNGGYSR
jgi:hypothetical protein